MRDMPLPFELEGKGGVGFLHKFCRDFSQEINSGGGCAGFGVGDWSKLESCFGVSGGFVGLGAVCEPTSVLETKRSPSPSSASTSTLSSSFASGGGGSTDTAGVATVSGNPPEKWPQGHPQTHHQEISNTLSTDNSGNNSSNNVEASGGGGGMAKKDEWVNLDLFQQIPTNLDTGSCGISSGGVEKCGLGGGLEYWNSDLLESAAGSPGQDPSILRMIMGDVEDPSMGLNKLLQGSGAGLPNLDFQFGGGGLVDQGLGLDQIGAGLASATAGGNNLASNAGNVSLSILSSNGNNKGGGMTVNEPISPVPNPPMLENLRHPSNLPSNPIFASLGNSGFPVSFPLGQLNHPLQQHTLQNPHTQMFDCTDEKSHVLNHPQLLISQLQAQNSQNPAFFLPLPHNQLDQHLPLPPPAKRHNPGIPGEPNRQIPKTVFSESGQLPLVSCPQQLHLLPYVQHQNRPAMVGKPKMSGDEMMIQQQAIEDQLHKAAELIEAGSPILAQEILARLNHQLSSTGKPFSRVAFYFKESLRLLLMNNPLNNTGSAFPFNLIFKIGAYKSFSEISPLVQFANFTCNQAVLEALEGFDQLRIVDFDIGCGGQWASLMQELALRKGGVPTVKITAFASPTIHDQLELSLTRENLTHFAQEMNISFEFEIINLGYFNSASSWSLPFHVAEGEAVAVNLPVSSLCNSPVSPTIVLRLIKQLSPKIVVSVDRGCDRNDLPFAHHIHQAFQSYLVLLESLDAVNPNLETLQKIETFLVRPGIERLVLGRHASPGKTQHWKTLFLSAGFSPVNFSNFTECQAEWLLKRTLAPGFQVEKKQSSLVLYWQRKELISASAWRC